MVALPLFQSENIVDFPHPQYKSNERYTPARNAQAARRVMGSIDLDPASCEEANEIIGAGQFYTEKQDGLAQEGLTKPFVLKLIVAYQSGQVKQAILCVTTDTDARWFIPLYDYSICFADHKVMFHRPGQANSGQFYGTCFVYFGKKERIFAEVFSEFGPVYPAGCAVRRRPPVTSLSLWEEVSP